MKFNHNLTGSTSDPASPEEFELKNMNEERPQKKHLRNMHSVA